MITSRAVRYLLRAKPEFLAQRFGHSGTAKVPWRIDFKNPYPKPGPNPFDSPAWTLSTWHCWGKRIATVVFLLVLADFRFVADWDKGLTRDPFTIRLINAVYPDLEKRYMEHEHKSPHH